ncbi:hypothetical protein FACS189434_08310 [Bacteroidia bacterium]|nr:hypothetical protein FACS189434_08310 [Bacteroidia bacterium]
MAIVFKKTEECNPQGCTTSKMWYPSLKTLNKVSERQIIKEVSDGTMLSRKDTAKAMIEFKKVMLRNFLASNSIELGNWGVFSLTCNGEGSNSKEEVSASKIKELNVSFTAGKDLQESLKAAIFIAEESVLSDSYSILGFF